MKRRFLKIFALITVFGISMGILASCVSVPEHTHEFLQNYYYDDENHWIQCSCDEKSEVEAHEGGVSDCEQKAKCDKCGMPYGELTPHEYKTLNSDETNHWYECVCGAKSGVEEHNHIILRKNENSHWYECKCKAKKDITEHDCSIPRFRNDTTHWLKCACGYEEEGKAHVLVDLICHCGYKAPGWDHVHSFDILRCDSDGHWYECVCNKRGEKTLHSGGTATCTEAAKCEICTVSYGDFADHNYSNVIISEENHSYQCACGKTQEPEAHSFVNGVCACGYNAMSATHTHQFSSLKYNEKEHWYECICKVSFSKEAHNGGKSTCEDEATCEVCRQKYGDLGHKWNNGELTMPNTVDTSGMITYTCSECEEKKVEIVPAGVTVLTRADLEAALVSVAWAYYMKGEKMQYDSIALSAINNHYGGTCRHTREASPEYGTEDTTIYSVCTGFPTKVYLEALDHYIWEGKYSPNGVLTMWFWLAADNQSEENFRDYHNSDGTVRDPITENDKDTALLRWMDFEKYLEDEAEEVPFAYTLGTFESSSFVDWYSGGTLEFYKGEGEDSYSYYLDGKKITPSEAKELVLAHITEQKNGEYVNLRPGDLLTEDTHTLLYIGNGYVLDCNGMKYDIEAGVDDYEERGGISRNMKTIKKTLESAVSDYIVSRPLDYYAVDYDGDPGNDIIMYNGEIIDITDATYSRLQYDAMEIDRTVDVTPWGAAEQNGTLTYTIKVSNNSNESNYIKWMRVREKGYLGVDYEDVLITEIIPEGTELVSASDGYDFENGVLTWNVDIPIGSFAEISYTVRVTAEAGSIITSEGGSVASIPSNSISNKVVCGKLSDTHMDKFSEIVGSDTSTWKDEYGTGLDFAENIYSQLGIDLDLPDVEDIIENLFTPTYFEKQLSMTVYYSDKDTPIVMYVPQDDVSGKYLSVQEMLIDRYFGGYRFFGADLEKFKEQGIEGYDFPKELDKTILEFSLDYLEVGDIIVYVTAADRSDTGMSSEISSSRILIYAGNNTLIEMSSDGNAAIYIGEAAELLLDASFKNTNDLFFALRPSQVYEYTTE